VWSREGRYDRRIDCLTCVGIGGSGRQSATKLAANICASTLYQIEITKHYTTVEWRDDIKKVRLLAAALFLNLSHKISPFRCRHRCIVAGNGWPHSALLYH